MTYVLPQLLQSSASRFGARTAISCNEDELTYSELELQTNQIANQLVEAGVRRGDRVGIYVNKSIASVLAVFGILKTGAAYVPLDPNAPAERLALIARDCGIKVLISVPGKVTRNADLLKLDTPIRSVLLLESGQPDEHMGVSFIQWETIVEQGGCFPIPHGHNENDLAYILYTSGSTGRPKGVMITHRTILTFVNWSCAEIGLTENDRTTSHAPLHFDLSTFDIFSSIKAGAKLTLIPENFSLFPVKLAELLEKEKITVTYLVPSILVLLIVRGNLDKMDLGKLRTVIFAGEVFPIKYLKQLSRIIPNVDLYNWFGPTETNVCTYYKVQAADLAPDRKNTLPIGGACANTDTFLVSEDNQVITESGRVGELWVRGPCVASGYWNDPDKTKMKFVRNPFQEAFDETVYRTGDIVELDESGKYIYHGRRDHMIKTRGYRVELGEIESRLDQHPDVSIAIVVPIPDEMVGNVLFAYIVANEGCVPIAQDVRSFCAQTLPRYMLPEEFFFIDSMPMTSSGKIDRVSLVNRKK